MCLRRVVCRNLNIARMYSDFSPEVFMRVFTIVPSGPLIVWKNRCGWTCGYGLTNRTMRLRNEQMNKYCPAISGSRLKIIKGAQGKFILLHARLHERKSLQMAANDFFHGVQNDLVSRPDFRPRQLGTFENTLGKTVIFWIVLFIFELLVIFLDLWSYLFFVYSFIFLLFLGF